jgi:hypothetical protein
LLFGFEFTFKIQQYGFFDVFEKFFKVPPIGEDTVSDCVSRPASVFISNGQGDPLRKLGEELP